jgi:hypothetical protein
LKIGKSRLAVLLIFLLLLTLLPATALAANFELKAENGSLVADQDTKFITLFEQDTVSKVITGTVQLQNNNAEKELVINIVGIEISFNGKVAPYSLENKALFKTNVASFSDYCKPLCIAEDFTQLSTMLMQQSATGGTVATKLATTEQKVLRIAPEQTVDLIEFYFKPVNDADILEIDMFSFKYEYIDGARHTTWFGQGSVTVQACEENFSPIGNSITSPSSFKLHVQLPPPNVSANDTTREVNGYNSATMEWSDTEDGPYTSAAPIIGKTAQTIFVRAKGSDNYIGNDPLYGDYKLGLTSEAVIVVFSDADDPGPQWEITDKKDAYGVKIPSNAHSYNAGAGVVFYWDQKQKDEGILVIPPEYFTSNKSLTIVVNSSNEYRMLTVTAAGSFDVQKWVDEKGKVHNINTIWIRFN